MIENLLKVPCTAYRGYLNIFPSSSTLSAKHLSASLPGCTHKDRFKPSSSQEDRFRNEEFSLLNFRFQLAGLG